MAFASPAAPPASPSRAALGASPPVLKVSPRRLSWTVGSDGGSDDEGGGDFLIGAPRQWSRHLTCAPSIKKVAELDKCAQSILATYVAPTSGAERCFAT